MSSTKKTLIVAACAAFAAGTVGAWEIDTFVGNSVGWAGDSANVRYSAVSFPTGGRLHDSLDVILTDRWNLNPSEFNFSIITGDTSVSHSNFQNETWLENATLFTIPGVGITVNLDPPAECWSWALGAGIVEADVVFYQSPPTWNSTMTMLSLSTYGGPDRPFETTAMHEFGHFLGLNHENDEYNIMGEDWTHIHLNNGTARSYFGEDAADGAVEIYGTDSSAGQDVSVSHFEWSGRDGEYSIHNWTDLRDTAGNRLPNTPSGPNYKTYEVSPGDTIQVEFTFENNGRSTQSAEVGFYISTNANITTFDDLFATRTPTQGRNDVYTRTYTLTLPSSLTPGTIRYLGALIDHDGAISEFDENNNAAHLKLEIQ